MKSFKKFVAERALSSDEEKKMEDIKKAMLADPEFVKKYGDDAKQKAFAMATAQAKKSA